MSSASMTPHGFVTVRGRGYRPDQVDAYVAALSDDRDAAWERAARLTVLAKDMRAEAARLGEVVAGLPPQTYEALGEGARQLFQFVLDEAADVRDRARRAAQEEAVRAGEYAESAHRAAREAADALRAEAEEYARQRLDAARAEAEDLRKDARRDVRAWRGEALAALREARQRTAGLPAEQAGRHAGRWAAAGREEAARAAAFDAWQAERVAGAEAALSEAKRALGQAEEAAHRCQEEARARAAGIVAEARARAEHIARETERLLREHGEAWDDVQAQMDSARSRLISLTGRTAWE
ncbi:cellulose-binding protein [Streptomyces sp. TG1A-8]|uniref:cellulose-binding protein n=1 Tax=Streptomyces sp. TG1A-8 TaxID=3051385 RepID=UPI00265C3794|nr:cellulose-binding protein [Streptomyces sp. TG1A-8]MDO0927345.1 cellulose-binding protein [Streptomyces sp. TG1A-8]